MDELKVFTGNAHPTLAQAVAEYLDIPLGKAEVLSSVTKISLSVFWIMSAKEILLLFNPSPPQ